MGGGPVEFSPFGLALGNVACQSCGDIRTRAVGLFGSVGLGGGDGDLPIPSRVLYGRVFSAPRCDDLFGWFALFQGGLATPIAKTSVYYLVRIRPFSNSEEGTIANAREASLFLDAPAFEGLPELLATGIIGKMVERTIATFDDERALPAEPLWDNRPTYALWEGSPAIKEGVARLLGVKSPRELLIRPEGLVGIGAVFCTAVPGFTFP